MFMEQNASALEQQAVRTTSFLSDELNKAKAKLDEQDARLAQFKRQYMGSLPEEEQSNLGVLMSLNSQLEANSQALNRAQADKAFGESLLDQQEANWKSSQTGPSPETMENQLRVAQEQLTALETLYTAKHPDVIKKRTQVEELKKRLAEEPEISTPAKEKRPPVEPAQIQQLRASLRQQDLNIADLTKRQTQIQDQIRVLQGRVQASPMVEQQLKEFMRNYQSAADFYNELLKNREHSAMATSLAHQQEGEQFRVLDPPSLPASPSFPKKINFVGDGSGAGLILSLAILYILMTMDKTLHTEKDVEACLKVPVLVGIPMLEIPDSNNSRLSFPEQSVVASE
jgi:uncharacterized protein involved in exopolysaccharide biosynthesis